MTRPAPPKPRSVQANNGMAVLVADLPKSRLAPIGGGTCQGRLSPRGLPNLVVPDPDPYVSDPHDLQLILPTSTTVGGERPSAGRQAGCRGRIEKPGQLPCIRTDVLRR